MNLVLTKSVNNVIVDGYYGDETAWFTREQIGSALEYEYPAESVGRIHNRHKERLDLFSRVSQVDLPSGGKQECFVYSTRGVFEICRWSKQPKADMVMDALYDMAEEVMKKGYYSAISDNDLIQILSDKRKEDSKFLSKISLSQQEQRVARNLIATQKVNDLLDGMADMDYREFESKLSSLYNEGLTVTEYNRAMSIFTRYEKRKVKYKRDRMNLGYND